MIIPDLKNFGLSDKQARVYLACLELNRAGSQRISEQAGLAKSTTSDTLKTLVKKGLLQVYLKKSKKQFTPANPNTLKNKIDNQSQALERLLPQLLALYGQTNAKPQIRLYEGKQGVKVVMKEILAEAKELIGISSAEDVFEKFSEYYPRFPQLRAKKKIPIRLILQDSPKAHERKELGPKELRQVKIVKPPLPFKSQILVWHNKIALTTLGQELIILIIESKDLSQTFRSIFELLWGKE